MPERQHTPLGEDVVTATDALVSDHGGTETATAGATRRDQVVDPCTDS